MHVELHDVEIAYGDQVIVRHLTATVRENRVTALTGPSGSGKSSLLAVIAGFQEPTSGRIEYVQDGVASPPDSRSVVWVPQGANALPNRTVLDNVAISALADGIQRSDANERATAALGLVGLGKKTSILAKTLSGGELQRVALARGMTSGRPLIFADEPSAGLDLDNVRLIAKLIRDMSGVATLVVATHDELLQDSADEVVDLRRVSA